MDVVTFIFLSVTLVFRYTAGTEVFHCTCPERWKLNHSTNDFVVVNFTNRTLSGNHSFFQWHWKTNAENRWDTSLWISCLAENLLGNAVLTGSDGAVIGGLVWKLYNGTVEWSYYGSELNESYWAISLCRGSDLSFTRKTDGKWAFQMSDIDFYQPNGKVKIIMDKLFEKEIELEDSSKPERPGSTVNQISEAATYRKYHRFRRSRVEKEKFVHSNSSPAEKWEIVQAVLDRVFGNSDDIRQNGWVSHFNIFRIFSRIFEQFLGLNSSLAPPATTESTATKPEAETVNTNTLKQFPGARIKSKKI